MEDRPECIRAFFHFLEWIPEDTDALFILGDFFEFWVGDDVNLPHSSDIAKALSLVAKQKDLSIGFMPGNRDFAIGQDYCTRAGMTLLEDDEVQFTIGKHDVLLSHGDIYCTDDKKYLRFRRIIRNPWVLKLLRSLNKNYRIKLAESLRTASKRSYQRNPVPIDVASNAIESTLNDHQSDILVHGHTHLADIHLTHDMDMNSKPSTRMVLGDWHQYGWYGKIDADGPTLHRFDVKSPVF